MELTNTTDLPARMMSGSPGDREMLYVVASKVTYVLDNGWLVPVSGSDAWPVFDKPFVYDGVTLGPEVDFRKQGIDILVFGNAVAPGRRPAQQMSIGVACGKFRHQAVVFGDRVWTRRGDELVPSEPEPYVDMPLRNERAFGGRPMKNGFPMNHPINPDGRGFYLSSESAEGQALPNLERPGALIRTWTDLPLPACFFKPLGSMMLRFPEGQDIDRLPAQMMVRGFNQAVPDLIASVNDLGPVLSLTGFSEDGEVRFPMPRGPGPVVHVSTGTLRSRFPSTLSTVLVLVAERVLILTYVAAFRYLMRPMEQRHAELRWPGDHRVAPVSGERREEPRGRS